MQKTLLTFVAVTIISFCFAQGTFIPLGTEGYNYIDRYDIKFSKITPIGFTDDQPYLRSKATRIAETLLLSNLRFTKVQQAELQYLVDENPEWLDSLESHTRQPLWKLYREPTSFVHYSSRNKGLFDIRFNPMIEVQAGVESEKSRFVFTRSVGLEVRGNIKKVFSFYFNATGNSARPAAYVADKIIPGVYNSRYVYVPGEAYWKDYTSKLFKFTDGVDYFDARGYVNANILKYINVSFGRDKFFIGNGQRSLFLSDYAAPYLFLRLNINVWRFNYQSIFAELTSQYFRGTDQLLPKKYMAVHHLSIQATHWLNVGLFEGVVMQRSNHFELQYLNPIIFYRAVEHALGSPDNELIGADFKMNFINHVSVYGQLLLDEFNFSHAFKHDGWWANKWAIQVGAKYIDIVKNLDGQIEFNIVRPFTYTHESNINYSHYNQPLAHPLGANFYELIFHLHYHPMPKLAFDAKYFVAKVGDDTLDATSGALTNYGGDILRSSGGGTSVTRVLGNKITQGAKGTINYFQLFASYSVWHNIYIDASILYRTKSTEKSAYNPQSSHSTFMFTVGARMNIGYKKNEF